ncbi:MAG: NnrU family protein [Sphingosinicella sp.]
MTPIAQLALATLFLIVSHFALSHPLRAPLVRLLGERGFIFLFMAVAIAALAWIGLAWGQTEPEAGWVAPLGWWPVASAITLFASILLAGSLFGNPAFPRPGAKPRPITRAPTGVFAITRHPANWSFMLWALAHLSLSFSTRNLVVAGGVLFLALFGTLAQDRKKERLMGEAWRDWEARTSFVPFAGLIGGKLRWRNALPSLPALIGGALFWALVTSWHAPLVSPLGDAVRRLF